jgi:hypothetical protein
VVPRRTYVLSVHEAGGDIVLEEVKTRRRMRLSDFSEIGGQIEEWGRSTPGGQEHEHGEQPQADPSS